MLVIFSWLFQIKISNNVLSPKQ